VFIAFNGPVPVTWLDFEAKVVGANDVDLNWSTASEENNNYFVVERSLDGEVFESVSKHINGAGNSSEVNHYNHVDLNVPNGVIYYRVKQVDFDGQFEYSEIRLVNIFEQRTVVVYPNPARNEVNIQVNGANGEQVRITNLAGQEVAASQVTSHGFVAIDATELPNGIYFVSIQSRWHNEIRKVIVQK